MEINDRHCMDDSRDTYMEVGGTTTWKWDDSRDGGGREGLEHILKVERIRRQSRELLYKLSNCGF